MFRDLYTNLTAREQRALRWSAAATAAALWLATAWTDPWLLLAVPLVGRRLLRLPRPVPRTSRTRTTWTSL